MGGRGPDAYDCFGLLKECYWRWHKIELPDYPSSDLRTENERLIISEAASKWKLLDKPIPGSALLFTHRGFGAHVGFMISYQNYIHAAEDQVKIERLTNFPRVMGAYHYVV